MGTKRAHFLMLKDLFGLQMCDIERGTMLCINSVTGCKYVKVTQVYPNRQAVMVVEI